MIGALHHLLFPAQCLACETFLEQGSVLCNSCKSYLEFLPRTYGRRIACFECSPISLSLLRAPPKLVAALLMVQYSRHARFTPDAIVGDIQLGKAFARCLGAEYTKSPKSGMKLVAVSGREVRDPVVYERFAPTKLMLLSLIAS